MNEQRALDRFVSVWLIEQAGSDKPGYLDEILARTQRTPQRAAWSSLERWLPMQATLRLAPVPRVAWLVLVLGLAAALLVAYVVGHQPHRLPAPFGPARNGVIVYAGVDNDIHALDPVTGKTTGLITGATVDHRPQLSPDGTKLMFVRDTAKLSESMLMVANADGSDVRPLTSALAGFTEAAWSHDGTRVAVVSAGARSKPGLQVFTVDGSNEPVLINTHLRSGIDYLSWRPGDRALTFRGEGSDGDGLITVAADGSDYWPFVVSTVGDGASLSPDGTRVAYQTWDGRFGTIHVVAIDASGDAGVDTVPVFDPPSSADLIDDVPTWSPDGTQLLFIRYHAGSENHLSVAPAAGGQVIEIGPAMPNIAQPVLAQFSPDGTRVLVHYDADGSTWLLDPTGATPGVELPSSVAEAATWQRLAP
jgi:Tol biopolymer transport system component